MHRYPGPYHMMRPGFLPRPMPQVGVVPLQRPPIIPGIRGAPPVIPPTARPPTPAVTPSDKPPTAVYVGKIAPAVDNEFLLSLLQLCGPVKSWKRTQNPSSGKPVSFGFCEFESAEGILRATRLLNKLSIDGQELVVNINDATKEYLKKHVEEKKKAQEKAKETEDGGGSVTNAVTGNELSKPVTDETEAETGDTGDKDNEENPKKFGIVTEEDSEADKDVAEKISSMIEEWLKTRPPPPPPPPPVQQSADISSKHKNGESGVDMTKTDSEDKNNSGTGKRPVNETEKVESGSPDKRKDRERDKEKRDKEKELERYERERERERVRRDREKEHKYREVERLYKDRLKEWESREREKEYQRQYEKEREKERERERKREISKQEDESDEEDTRKRRRRSSGSLEERKRRRLREKEEDLADKLKEEEEIVEARKRAVELQQQADEATAAAAAAAESATVMEVDGDNGNERDALDKPIVVDDGNIVAFANGVDGSDGICKDNNGNDKNVEPGETLDAKHNSNAPAKKLGFGLIGSGKRTSVPSVFAEEDDEDNDDKRARPLVPIDYSTEELQAVEANSSTGQANIVAAAEFAKRILVSNTKDDRPNAEKDRGRRSSDKLSQRDRDRNNQDGGRISDERREKARDRERDKTKNENKNILDAKQLIDMIPRTKEELFAYDINWAIYDKVSDCSRLIINSKISFHKFTMLNMVVSPYHSSQLVAMDYGLTLSNLLMQHELHERMRPWIAKKIVEFLGEEESTLVDYIVSCTKDHVQASKMLELLHSILDVEAEMFVLKMWRMLIFEIKKVESGLSGRTKA
ncbi:hypothetical protein ABZP36_029277 [Zizania latifolia]